MDNVAFVSSDGEDYYTFRWDDNSDVWAEDDCDPCAVSEDFEGSYSIEIGSATTDAWDNSYIDDITIHNNTFYDDSWDEAYVVKNNIITHIKPEEDVVFTLPDSIPEGSTIVFASDGSYPVETPAKKGGELYLKGCEVVEMKGLDFSNTKVKIEDSENIKMTESHFGSTFPIEGSMVEFTGDTRDVSLSHSLFDMTVPEELYASVGYMRLNTTTEVPKSIKNVKEDVEMATSLSVTLWVLVFIVALVAAITAKRASWRSLLWPIKKLFKRAEAEGKKVEEVWESIE